MLDTVAITRSRGAIWARHCAGSRNSSRRRVDPSAGSQIRFAEQLKPGRAYVWDTYWPHRARALEKKDFSRISIVLGFAPCGRTATALYSG